MGESLPPREGERIPRRTAPDFNELGEDVSVVKGIFEGGFLNVAINDTNQFQARAVCKHRGVSQEEKWDSLFW